VLPGDKMALWERRLFLAAETFEAGAADVEPQPRSICH
jgi:hypothetical protein